ncbi:MAG: hypothetical protein HYY50_03775 [Candidatus Kerfeldbacteria bacterium]|nr:hypothetical protein [Candidatus Kerfeldbacteria bacterium]
MSLDFIALLVLFLSLAGVATLILRKFPLLAALRGESAPHPLAARKSSLLEERLKRKFQSWWSKAATTGQPLIRQATTILKRSQRKLLDLEHEYQVRSLPIFLNRRQRQKVDRHIAQLLDQAQLFRRDEEYRAAEGKVLQAIRLDPRSVPAFQLLGQLYLGMKEYGHAKEVYKYLLKLVGDSDATYEHLAEADIAAGHLQEAGQEIRQAIALNGAVMTYYLELAQVERGLGHWADAFQSVQEAVRLEPNNPKVLDELIEVSLGYGKKQFAEDAVAKVKAKNPDNSKIVEWEQRLSEL